MEFLTISFDIPALLTDFMISFTSTEIHSKVWYYRLRGSQGFDHRLVQLTV